MIVSVAEHERYRARIADLARLHDRRPFVAEIDARLAEYRRRWVRDHRPPVLSLLTGRPTPELPDAYHRLGPLPLDPAAAVVEHRRRRALLAR